MSAYWVVSWVTPSETWQTDYSGWDEGAARSIGGSIVAQGQPRVVGRVYDDTAQRWRTFDFVANDWATTAGSGALAWTQLPDGEAIVIAKGFFYAVTAEVSFSGPDGTHDRSFILQTAAKNGLQVFDYQDPAALSGLVPKSGYRFVALQGLATKDAGTVPWKAPWPLSLADSSHLVHVWTVPQGKNMPARPPPPPLVRRGCGGSCLRGRSGDGGGCAAGAG